jgi:PKD domain
MSRMRSAVIAILLAGVWLTLAAPVSALYLFLDVDGDGEWTARDNFTLLRLDPWIIDLYMVTHENQDIPCLDDVYSYKVHLFADGAPFVIENVENMVPGMTESFPMSAYPYAATLGYERIQPLGPGKWHLLRLTVRFQYGAGIMGCPALAILPSTCYSPEGAVTSVVTACGDEVPVDGTGFYGCSDMTGHAPTITCPAEVHGREGESLSFQAVAGDPECGEYPFDFQSGGFPSGAVVTPLSPFRAGEAVQEITWTPSPGQAGEYIVNFLVQKPDPFNFTERRSICTTRIVIENGNGAPAANSGGPYAGVTGSPVQFDGSSSIDPDGDPLDFSWSFGDGTSAEGPWPLHSYGSHGTFPVVLTVSDPAGSSDVDSTTAAIVTTLPASVFTSASDQIIRIEHGKPHSCFHVEPGPGTSYSAGNIAPASLRFHVDTPGCGSVPVTPTSIKRAEVRDADGDGIEELGVCFGTEAWSPLVSCLTPGESRAQVRLSGSLHTGEQISAFFNQRFLNGRLSLAASITPNPLLLGSTLRLTTTQSGYVTVALYDVQGRKLGVLLDERTVSAGMHDIPLKGYDTLSGRLASGVYFVKVGTQHDGVETRAVTILR